MKKASKGKPTTKPATKKSKSSEPDLSAQKKMMRDWILGKKVI